MAPLEAHSRLERDPPAPKTGALTYYANGLLVACRGFEPLSSGSYPDVLPIERTGCNGNPDG